MNSSILGYRVYHGGVERCCDDIFYTLQQPKKKWLACLNPHSYAVASRDFTFETALKSTDWLVPDGVGVVLASRILNSKIDRRVTGFDIFYGLSDRMNNSGGYKVFFLGSTQTTLDELRIRMAKDFPRVEVVGIYSPPFKSEYSQAELGEMIAAINNAKADVLWVGMTAPKQEKWIFQNLPALDVRFACAIGAVFDFYTGRVKRAHPGFQKFGLEWLPRLLQQPRRLWRRMFVSAPVFLWDVFKERWKFSRRQA